MPSIEDRVQKSLVYVVGGSPIQRLEIEQNLKSFYMFEIFERETEISERLSTSIPSAIIVDAIMPPMGGAGFVAKVRNNEDTKTTPIVFIAEKKNAEIIAEATSYDRVFLIERPFRRGTFISALSSGINASIEARWDDIEPTQQKALKNTLNSFNSIANLIQEGEPIPYDGVRHSCAPLIEAVQNNNFKDMLSGVSEHDNYSYVHSLRVATFLCLFGNVLGIQGEDLMTLSTGGLLHDVGKMHIPYEVLNKPGKLTDDEFATMKSHVTHSIDFLNKSPELPKGVIIIAAQHHEKLDGTGYPFGLKGAEMNELARMASIIDIFSAITDRRVYKEPVPPDQALKIMENMKDHLDQQFLAVFREMLLDGATH